MAQALIERLKNNINQYLIGKQESVDLLLIALFAQGHVLIEDVPGIGKTTMVHALAKSLDLRFKRIQFTPDVMPSDITGFNLYNPKLSDFVFQPGSLMAQLVLADEINRASPKTQSALLEAMQEQQVTVDQVSYPMQQPFMVLATQNPIEYVGTYPLPEAQLDRFMLRIRLGYPTVQQEIQILETYGTQQPLDHLTPIASAQDILTLQQQVHDIHVADPIKQYIVELMVQTRQHPEIKLGGSPRASLMLLKASKASALLDGRHYVIAEDVQKLFEPVLGHRLQLQAASRLGQRATDSVLTEILNAVYAPRQ